jgi:hypothetical protein
MNYKLQPLDYRYLRKRLDELKKNHVIVNSFFVHLLDLIFQENRRYTKLYIKIKPMKLKKKTIILS